MHPQSRRAFLAELAALTALSAIGGARPARAEPPASRSPPDLDVRDIEVEGDKKLATRFTLFVPNHLAKGERVPLLVLLHGLGEAGDQGTGVYAWVERYGLGTAYARLRRPPVERTYRSGAVLSDARLAEINTALGAQPFHGMAVACPYTPIIGRLPDPEGALDAYAAWIADVVVPRARREAPVIPDSAHTALDGVSMGGYVGVEVFTRRPEVFCAWGGVQSAFGAARAPRYADKIASTLGKPARTSVRLATTDGDPFREASVALADALAKRGVASDLVVTPGQHDQVFLREAGALEMLLWHDRRLRP